MGRRAPPPKPKAQRGPRWGRGGERRPPPPKTWSEPTSLTTRPPSTPLSRRADKHEMIIEWRVLRSEHFPGFLRCRQQLRYCALVTGVGTGTEPRKLGFC